MFFFSANNTDLVFESQSLEHAYFSILGEDLNAAEVIFMSLDSPRARWGCTFVGILKGFIETYPTYFEIRNFLEIDLDFLLKNNKIDYVEMVLGSLEILSDINQETYKYVARVMLENKYYQVVKNYLDKSKDIFYNDPELHFLYAKYYLINKDYFNADFYLDECLNILPDYYPAKSLQNEIAKYLA